MANSLPEVKWEKWPPEHLPVRVFAIFYDVSRCNAMSRNMYIFNPGGLPYERGGDARRKF